MQIKTRLLLLLAMLWSLAGVAQTVDSKDVQVAKQKLQIGPSKTKYFSSITDTITASSTNQQVPTAAAVYEYGQGLGGGGGVSTGDKGDIDVVNASNDWRVDTSAIDSVKLAANAVQSSDIKDGQVWSADLAANAITNVKMADNAIGSAEITDGTVALADLANMATSSLYYRKTAGAGPPEVNTLATLKTDLGLTGTNSGDQTITLTGDVTGSGTGSFAATIADNSVDGTDIALGSDAQGDVMYYNGTDWVRLPAGTNGQYLQTQGAAANPQWATVSAGGNYQTLRDNGVNETQRAASNFVNSATVTATLTDDAANGETEISLTVPTDGITATQIAADAVASSEIAANAVGNSEMADNAIGSAEITDGTVALADLANMATSSLYYRKTAGAGPPEVNTLATLKTDLGLTGTNSGDQTITLTGDVTGSGTGSFAATIADNSVDGTDIALGSDAQGDVMYYNGTDWVRLPAGTNGQYLQTQGAAANPQWATVSAGGNYQTLKDEGVSVAQQPNLNVLQTASINLNLTNDAANSETELTAIVRQNGITDFEIAADAVGTSEIANASILAEDLNQMGAASGEVLKWNGSAWAPATDNTSGGGANYQTFRDNGTNETQRAAANFISSATVTATLTDDAVNGETEISLTVPTDGITATQIAADAVASSEIAANAVGNSEMADNAIGSAEITDGTVALADLANMATSSLYYRKTAGAGPPEVNTLATLKTDLGLTGTNSGDQTITLTGDVTGSGTGSFAATIADNSVDGTDIALGSDAQGDVMYYNGTDWVRLPAGTNGQYLQTQGAAANPQWATVSAGGNYQTLRDNGVNETQRAASNFVNSATVTATLTDDAANGETEISLTVPTDGITATQIATDAVGSAEIAANAVGNAEMADNAIGSAEITDGTVALADLANMATSSLYYRKTAGAGPPEVNTLATLKTDLGLTGTNSGDQTITLTGDVTGSGTGSFAATIADNSVDGTDIALGSDAQGDVMYYNGTDWVRLPAGTNGQYLQTQGAAANPQWATITAGTFYQRMRDNGTNEVQRSSTNFISSATVTATLTDDGVNDETEISLTVPNDGIGAAQIATDAVGSAEIAANAVGSAEIAANAVTNAKVNDVSAAKLTSGTVPAGLTLTATNNGSINTNYNSGAVGFQLDDISSACGVYSEDGTQYVYADNVSTLIGSGTTNMQYIDGVLRLNDSDITNWIGIQPPATGSLTANYTLTLPVDDGTAGQVLQTDGAGVLSWASAGGGGFYQTLRENGTARTQRGKINFVTSSNTVATVVDDAANDESEVKFEVGIGAITANEIATNAVNSTEITDGQVFSVDIADGTIVNNDVNAGSLNPNRLAQTGATTNQTIKWNDTEWVPGNMVIVSDYTSTGIFTVDGAKAIDIICVGAGGGGGSGRKGANGGIRSGGGGGAGGAVAIGHFDIADLGNPVSITVTVGTGGNGGASQATNSTNGNAGGAGGSSWCAVSGTIFIQAAGGGGGAGGTNAGGAGGAIPAFGDFQAQAGAASPATGVAGVAPTDSWNKCGGSGGSGGGITAANATSAGGNGGKGYYTLMNGGTGGAAGVAGGFGDFVSLDRLTGGGGGGGGSKTTAGAAAGNGAAGAEGAGGGGGGAGTDGAANSGAGGAGGSGFVRIIARY